MDTLTSKQSSAIFEVIIWSSICTILETLAKKDCKTSHNCQLEAVGQCGCGYLVIRPGKTYGVSHCYAITAL